MSIHGIEPVIAGLLKRLQDDLPAAIDQVNSEATDGIMVEQPKQIVDFIPPLELLVDFPVIGIAEGSGRFQDDTGYEATGLNELHVACYLAHPDQQTLARQLRRLRLAVARVILNGRVIPNVDGTGNAAWGVTLARFTPGPTLGEVQGHTVESYFSNVTIVIQAMSDEV